MRFVLFQRQVRSLLYKTYLQRKRSLGCTFCELLAPVVLAMLLLVLPTWAGLTLEVTTKNDEQPIPDPSQPFTPRSDIQVDPFMSQSSNWGLFRELTTSEDGNTCWCKTLAIVGDSRHAGAFKAFMEQEYAYLKYYYSQVRNQPFTNPDFVPGFTDTDPQAEWVECPSWNTDTFFRIFESESDLNDYIGSSNYGEVSEYRSANSDQMDRLCGAVQLPDGLLVDRRPTINLRFNITWNRPAQYVQFLTKTNLVQDTRSLDNLVGSESARYWYMLQGFIGVQIMTQRFLRLFHSDLKGSTDPGSFLDSVEEMVNWQIYPFPSYSYTSNETLDFLSNFQFVLLFCFATTVALTIGRIVREREQRLREYMRMMGMYDISYYVAWIIVLATTWAIIALGVTGMAYIYAFSTSSFGMVFLFNFIFGLASMSFSFFISAFCTRERLGSIIGFFLYFLCQAITVPDYSPAIKYNAASLIPPAAYIMGTRTMFFLESSAIGFSVSSAKIKVYGYSMEQALVMLTFDVFFWWILYYYVEQVNPFIVGYTRKWYFPFTLDYWKDVFGIHHYSPVHIVDGDSPSVKDPAKFEAVTDARLARLETENKCIKTKNLKKRFGSNFFAVKGIDLTMYSGEIYCLLGHNGAGKTTTFSMLTGMTRPTAGSITALGLEIPRDMGELRRSMGVCPQHSALWDELTVMEHLKIFAGIRGLKVDAIQHTLEGLIHEVGLVGRSDFQAKALSGGMKRKLSVGIAFVGDPKLVFLDEPTSGMDPFARRSTWDLLKRKRADRVICLTTHYMDEADVLGDRISIMSKGAIECTGTSMFLKKLYGCGYLLSFVKESNEGWANKVIVGYIEEFLGEKIRTVSSIGRELIVEVNESEKFPLLLSELDQAETKVLIGIQSYGISVTNIEEVFLKVANQAGGHTTAPTGSESDPEEIPKPPTKVFFWQQFSALLERRFRYGIRDKQLFFMQVFLPFIILIAGLGFLLVALDQTPTPITLEVDPLNPDYSNANYVQQGPVNDATSLDLWTDYCKIGNYTDSSTECNLLIPGTLGVTNLYDFQEVLLHNGSFPGADSWPYGPNPFLAYSYLSNPTAGGSQQLGVWQNSTGLHTTALGTLAQFNAWASRAGDVQVTLVNDPLPNTAWEEQVLNQITGTISTQMIVLAMSFIPTAVISFIVMEKEREVKNQLYISGVSVPAYWLSHFVFDSLFSVISTLVAMIVFWIYDVQEFIGGSSLAGSFAILLLYGPASTALAYTVSYVFEKQFAAQSFVAVASIIMGNLLVLLSYILQAIPTDSCGSCSDIGKIILRIGRFFPPFALGSGFYRLTVYVDPLDLTLTSSDLFGGCEDGVVWRMYGCYSGIGDDLFFLGVTTFLYLGIAILIDTLANIPSLRNMFVIKDNDVGFDGDASLEDEDVVAEKQRVDKLDKTKQMIFVNRARKLFRRAGMGFKAFWARIRGERDIVKSTTVYAVESVSFAADKGQVFGLLGVNGAGKTTTFKMLCGLYCPSGGDIYVLGLDASTKMAAVRRHVGYCPQFDALWDLLTTREHVLLYAKIRGYRGKDLETVVESKLKELDLVQYAPARAGTLSGGNKRKLSVAMALVGEPELVFLDEPSCGMDPFARRSMWNIIESVAEKRKQSVIILTTHSMEEAEALCSRVAIQVDGRFRCLGSCQQIKTRYGDGFEITLRSKPIDSSNVKSVEQIISEWDVKTYTDALKLSMTMENATEILNGSPGRLNRFNHKSYGLQIGVDSERTLVNMAEMANWIFQDEIFGGIIDFLNEEFEKEGFTVIELHGLTIKVKVEKLEISTLFGKLELLKEKKLIDDFQVSQTTLEQIFNSFAATAKNRQE
jgi:ATP-binding cassette subfamily A (ABC1) protein 3